MDKCTRIHIHAHAHTHARKALLSPWQELIHQDYPNATAGFKMASTLIQHGVCD